MAPQPGLRRSSRAASRATTTASQTPVDPSSRPSSDPFTTNARVTKNTGGSNRATTAPASGNKTRQTPAPRSRGGRTRGAPSTRQSRTRSAKNVKADGEDSNASKHPAPWPDEPPVLDIPTHELDNYKRPPFGEARHLGQHPSPLDMRRANGVPISTGLLTEKLTLGNPNKRKAKKGKDKGSQKKARQLDSHIQKPVELQQETPVANGETTINSQTATPAEPAVAADAAGDAAANVELDNLHAKVSAGLPLPGPLSAERVIWTLRKTVELCPNREELKQDSKYVAVEPKPDEEMTPKDWKQFNKELRVRYREKAKLLDIHLVLQKLHEEAADDPFLLHVAARAARKELTDEDRKVFKTLIAKLYRPVREDQNTVVDYDAEKENPTVKGESQEKAATPVPDAPNTLAAAQPSQTADVSASATPAPNGVATAPAGTKIATPPPTEEFLNWRKRRREQVEPDHSVNGIANKREKLEKAAFTQRGKVGVDYPESYVRRTGDEGHLAPEEPEDWEAASRCSTPETVISRLEPEDDGARKPDAHYFPRAEPLFKTSQSADETNNLDVCNICKARGDLLCCDGCVRSFHFTCLSPPLDPKKPPEGDWFCSDCNKSGVFPAVVNILESRAARDFQLPGSIRDRYKDVRTAANGSYETWPDDPGTKKERPKNDIHGVQFFEYKKKDDTGLLRICVRCRKTAGYGKGLILCDYCPSYWHKECLPMDDPAFYHRPNHVNQKRGGASKMWNPIKAWKCPNHAEHALNDAKKLVGFNYRSLRLHDMPGPEPADEDAQDFAVEADSPDGLFLGTEKQIIHRFITSVKAKHATETQARMQAEALARITAERIAAQNVSGATSTNNAGNNTGKGDVDVGMVDAEAFDALPAPVRTMEDLNPQEREAVDILANMRNQAVPPTPAPAPRNPAAMVVENLLQDKPLDLASATNELETLKMIQELINERVNSLTRPTNDDDGDGN